MGTLETEIDIMGRDLPVEYVRYVNAQHPDEETMGPDDEFPEVPVVIEYREGWYTPGKLSGPPEDCYPAEGEDPEIDSIVINDSDYKGPTKLELTDKQLQTIVDLCQDDQDSMDDYGGPEADDFYDDPSHDYVYEGPMGSY